MILLADSGSTKVHWCLVTASGQCSDIFTDGINPLFQTCDAMKNSISNQLLPQIAHLLWGSDVCSSDLSDARLFLWRRLYTGEESFCAKSAGDSV